MSALPIVKDVMDTVVPTLSPDDGIFDAVGKLLDEHVTGAPVVDNSGRVIGILTEYDCLKVLGEGDADAERPHGRVRDYMTSDVRTIPPDMNVYYAAGIFLGASFRRLPVVDGDGKLIGAITRYDILRALRKGLGK